MNQSYTIPEEEMEQARRYARGWVAFFIRKGYPWLDTEVLENEADLAVWRASLSWRPDGGANFYTFSTEAVIRALKNEIRRQSPLKITARKQMAALLAAGQELEPWMLTPASIGGSCDLADSLCGEQDPFAAVEARILTQNLLPQIEPRLATILRLYFLEGKTDRQIAQLKGISKSRVSVLRVRALERLRQLAA